VIYIFTALPKWVFYYGTAEPLSRTGMIFISLI